MHKAICTMGFLLALACLAGCGKTDDTIKENPIPVEVMQVHRGNVNQFMEYNGDIHADVEVRVFSKIPDRIEAYYVEEGDGVQKGDAIAKILSTAIEHGVTQARAGLSALTTRQANLKSEYDRMKNLYQVHAVSKQQYDAISSQYESLTAQVKQAEAILDAAQTQLKEALILAPMAGIIGRRFLEPGDMAMPSLPVATVVRMDIVKIQFQATETDLKSLSVNQAVQVTVKSRPEHAFSGKVSKISPVLDPLTRMTTVDVMIPNPDHLLRPGMYAKIRVTTGVLEDVIVIPRHAVIESTTLGQAEGKETVLKNYFAYVINDQNRAEQRPLRVRYADHMQIAVDAGLAEGEQLVVTGQNNLRDGNPVVIITPDGSAS